MYWCSLFKASCCDATLVLTRNIPDLDEDIPVYDPITDSFITVLL